jgi:hypothetical protein
MPCRRHPLTPPALLLAGLITVATAGHASAHRLEAEYHVLPDGKVQIESWFDLTGNSPKGAVVQVFRADGQALTEGRLDSQGIYVFTVKAPEPLRVVVSAGDGHRKELVIPAAELRQSKANSEPDVAFAADQASSPAPVPMADRSSRVSIKDVLIGIGFLLALAAFVLSVRNARRLGELKKRLATDQHG